MENLLPKVKSLLLYIKEKHGAYSDLSMPGIYIVALDKNKIDKLYNEVSTQIITDAQDATQLGGCEICGRLDGSHHTDCRYYSRRL